MFVSCCCLWLELDVCHDAVVFVVSSFAAQTKTVFVQQPLDSNTSEMLFFGVVGVYMCLVLCG